VYHVFKLPLLTCKVRLLMKLPNYGVLKD